MPIVGLRETFDRHQKKLLDEVLVMGSMVEQAVLKSVEALNRRDHKTALRVYQGDQVINQKHLEIENECLTLIATQQPMARDLRTLAAVLEINTELERIGDYAKGIARISTMLGDDTVSIPASDLQTMADLGLSMLNRALGAFIAKDAAAAKSISKDDDQIDQLFNHIHRELIHQVVLNPNHVNQANYLIWVAHNLERMADRVTNICERIIFVVTGEIKELDVSDDEFEGDDGLSLR